ncbi:hypothetical protein P692DRAFT_20551827, partial [Suillus brevipes Sb2]
MAWAARYHTEVEKRFTNGLAKVPSWGRSTDVLVEEYLDGMATWARANHCWSYETQNTSVQRVQRYSELGVTN